MNIQTTFRKIKGGVFIRNIERWKIHQLCKPYRVKLYNYCMPAPQDFWLSRFIEAKGLGGNKKIGIFSVFDRPWTIKIHHCDYKLFFARENVHRYQWRRYNNLCIDNPDIDLSIGYDYIENNEKYLRFPLWIIWLFSPNATYYDIQQICKEMNNSNSSYRDKKFCSFICSHNDVGRYKIYKELSQVSRIDCPGKLFHNDDSLVKEFQDNKLLYLKNYRFNLCPENSNTIGYCTEKIFEAISSGCIPIYNGSGNNPEPDILNINSLILFNFEDDNANLISRLRKLNSNESSYMNFVSQQKLLNSAPDRIMEYYSSLEIRLRDIIKNS